MPRGEGYLFDNKIVGGVIPSKYIPAVDRGIQEASARGVMAGFPLVDFRAEVYDGSTHSVDSNEMAFKMAGILAFKAVAPKCRPVILEPLDLLEIVVPDAFLGDVLGDVSGRRGQILGTDADGDRTTVRAVDAAVGTPSVRHAAVFDHRTGTARSRGASTATSRCRVDAVQKIIAENAREMEEIEA